MRVRRGMGYTPNIKMAAIRGVNTRFSRQLRSEIEKRFGLTIAPKTTDNEEHIIRNCFSELSSLKEELDKKFKLNLKELSMGMTNDYKIAVNCGATMIRIGKGIFAG